MAAQPNVRHLVTGLFRLVSTAAYAPAPRAGLIDLVGLLLTVLALLVAYKLTRPAPAIPVTDLPAASCDLQHETCRLMLPGGQSLTLRIDGHPARPNQPFVIEAQSDNTVLRPLEVSMRGIEIDMSSSAQPFQADGNGAYQATTTLPICTVKRMTWEVSVILQAGSERLRWPLFLTTESG